MASADVSCPSYPKTGNTWLRMLLGRYLQRLENLPFLPLLEGTDEERRSIGWTIKFSHGPLLWDTQTAVELTDANVCQPYLHDKVMLIVRHPLDALLSHFMHVHNQAGQHDANSLPATFDAFIRHPVWGVSKYLAYYNLWAARMPNPRISIVRYEDMHESPQDTVRRLLDFLKVSIRDDLVTDAISFASFDNMRSMEEKQPPTYRSSGFKIFSTGDRANPNAFHVRSGKIGGYRDHLSADQQTEHELTVQQLSPVYGYSR